jgi:hypothetical protein
LQSLADGGHRCVDYTKSFFMDRYPS